MLCSTDVKDNYLSAVLGMLSSIPKQVLESELSAVSDCSYLFLLFVDLNCCPISKHCLLEELF